jgi:hypothetical protein
MCKCLWLLIILHRHTLQEPAMATNHGLCALSHSLGMRFISTAEHVGSLHYECVPNVYQECRQDIKFILKRNIHCNVRSFFLLCIDGDV